MVREFHIDPDINNTKEVPIDKANDLIFESINELIAAQYVMQRK